MKVVVGLSGGVDSATTAAKYLEDGWDVVGCTLVMQRDPVPVPPDFALERAADVCRELGIEHVVVDCSESFSERVSRPFCDCYLSGATPSPCIVCNRCVKLPELVKVADELGADVVATGHYARKVVCDDGVCRIAAGTDPDRDQSYFLSQVPPEIVERLDLPLATWSKDMTRAKADAAGLSVAFAKDSQGVCFAPGGDYRALLQARRPDAFLGGDVVDEEGRVLGRHEGTAGFTVGQRKGLGLSGGPWYVQEIRPDANEVVVSREPCGRADEFRMDGANVTVGAGRLGRMALEAQTGHRMEKAPCRARMEADGTVWIRIDDGRSLFAVRGQGCALYAGDVVVAGGTIL